MMLKIARILNIALLFMLMAILKAEPIAIERASAPSLSSLNYPFQYASCQLWVYLRLGLNYLESPKPTSAPETVEPAYIHPDSKGFGAYGFSPGAYQDVQQYYPFFRNYTWQDILRSQQLYELANHAYADWLLKNMQKYIPARATEKEVFDVMQKAWNLGLSGFKNGRKVVASRQKRAEEFKAIRVSQVN